MKPPMDELQPLHGDAHLESSRQSLILGSSAPRELVSETDLTNRGGRVGEVEEG